MNRAPLQFTPLFQQGLALIEKYCSHVWTDYNTHDPGITQLDHLCYALTDLGFRVNHPIEDLLANPELESLVQALYHAEEILSCRPVTIPDWRKKLIDIKGVKNVWLNTAPVTEPVIYVDCDEGELTLTDPEDRPQRTVQPKGGYQVWVECEEETEDRDAVLQEVVRCCHTHRNLCEDFLQIAFVALDYVGICVEIEAAPEADLELMHARLIHAVETFIAPRLRFYTLDEMVARGLSSEDIFNGPLLVNGFLDNDELEAADRKDVLHLSDLYQVMMDVPDVAAVRGLTATRWQIQPDPDNPGTDQAVALNSGVPWVLPLDPLRASRFATQLEINNTEKRISRFIFYKNGVPFTTNAEEVEEHLVGLRAEDRHHRDKEAVNTFPPIEGDWRGVDTYFSIQRDFPLNYGIGHHGLPPSASTLRKAQAQQLKTWLLIFEQFLANYLAQLAGFSKLFSLEEIEATLFTQSPKDIPRLDELVMDPPTYPDAIAHIAETDATFQLRRNRFLDHLLARFGERFTEYALIAARIYGARAGKQILRDKIRFLTQIPQLSAHRFAAFNQLPSAEEHQNSPLPIEDESQHDHLPPKDDQSRSGLEDKLAALMGDITDHFDTFYMPNSKKYKLRMYGDGGDILFTSSAAFNAPEDGDVIRDRLLEILHDDAHYVREDPADPATKPWKFQLFDDGKAFGNKRTFDTEEDREAAIKRLQTFVRDYPAAKRIMLIEHLLLRPRTPASALLPACIKPAVGECYCDDPYSFRVHVILPYWLERFRDMRFRAYTERTIRELLPAHIYPTICWVDETNLETLEELHDAWRLALAGEADLEPAQSDLIHHLTQLKSVFPVAQLHDCVDGVDENPIVLGNTILGTFNEET